MFQMDNLEIDNIHVNEIIKLLKDKVPKVPAKIIIRSGCIVDAVLFQFENQKGYRLGGTGGGTHELILEEGETITECCGTYTDFDGVKVVAYLRFTTSKNRTLASHVGVREKMDFVIKGANLTNFLGKDAVNARGTGVYLKEIYAEEIDIELSGTIGGF